MDEGKKRKRKKNNNKGEKKEKRKSIGPHIPEAERALLVTFKVF